MAKKNKKKGRGRVRSLFGGAITFAPALLAAVTAFMNTSVARERGLVGNGNGKSKAKSEDEWFGDSGDSKKSRKKSKS